MKTENYKDASTNKTSFGSIDYKVPIKIVAKLALKLS